MLTGFRDFALRGNVIGLAVAVVVGAAFNALIDSLVVDILTPTVGLLSGEPDFSALAVGPVRVGSFLNALFAFLIKAAGLYFFVVLPLARLTAAKLLPAVPPPPPSPEVAALREIRDLLARQGIGPGPRGEP